MSLDVSLYTEKKTVTCFSGMHDHEEQELLYDSNITHNLATMAGEAGIYQAIWRPEEIGATRANHIINLVEKGLNDLKNRPKHFEQFNSPNGWGMYDHFVPFVEKYLIALKEYPESEIRVSR